MAPHSFDRMLSQINPRTGGEFVIASLPQVPRGIKPHATITEPEGVTVVLTPAEATRASLPTTSTYTLLTLGAPGSLEAVGLTAAVAQMLSSRSIPANVMSGVHHTHLFVPSALAREALAVLEEMSTQAQAWLSL